LFLVCDAVSVCCQVEAARQALAAATEESIPEGLLAKARASIEAAERAHQARDDAWAAVSVLVAQPPLLLNLKELRAALGNAKKGGVSAVQLEGAAAKLEVAVQAQQGLTKAMSELEAALKPPPLKIDVKVARAAIEAARAAAADGNVLSDAEAKVEAAAAAQQRRDAAAAAAEAHASTELLGVDLEVAKADLAAAREAGVEKLRLVPVVSHVKQAAALQAKAATARDDLEKVHESPTRVNGLTLG